jgi:FkbM family methyltransferase
LTELRASSVKEKLVDAAWYVGVRTFRLARRVNMAGKLEPAFIKLAGLIPPASEDVVGVLRNRCTLVMPAGYRDTRTVLTGLFQTDETRLFERLASPGMTFVDVGAYVGYFTVLASSWIGASGRVYAFEPDALAYQFLVLNVKRNACANVTLVNKAVTDRIGTMALVRDPLGPESFLTDRTDDDSANNVLTVTMDSFFEALDWPRIDILKMNIEGSELSALKGMREVSRRNPELNLVMEFNPGAMARAGVSRSYLTSVLVELGFRRGRIVERRLKRVPEGDLLPAGNTVYNVLLTK